MKIIVPVLEGYSVDGGPVFGQRELTEEERKQWIQKENTTMDMNDSNGMEKSSFTKTN